MNALADTALTEEIEAIKLKTLGPKPPPREKGPKVKAPKDKAKTKV